MANMFKTLIIVIIDESGSMDSTKSDVIGGFNSFIEEQKKIENDKAWLYLIKFNTQVSVLHKGVELEKVPPLTHSTYSPGGGTALYDAIAEGVHLVEKDKKKEDRVICVIMTDGEENSSKETTKKQVKNIIENHEKLGDWTFLYIGENPDRWTNEMKMSSSHGIQYDHMAPRANYARSSHAVTKFRCSKEARGIDLFDED